MAEYGEVAPARRAHPSPPPAPPSPGPDMVVYGYWPYWSDDVSTRQLDGLTDLAIFDVGVDTNGDLSSTSTWTGYAGTIVPLAHSYGVNVHLCVVSFDSDTMTALLGSSSARANAISQLSSLVDQYGADGVNVDFEGLPSSRRDEFVQFIQDLKAATPQVWLAMPAIDWNGAYDYDQLAAASDGLFIMGYEFHGTWGDPGPNDPLLASDTWGSYSLQWSLEDYQYYGAPNDKIVMGLPLYGHEWEATSAVPGDATGDASSISMIDATEEAAIYGRQYDAGSSTAYYMPSGWQVWYDDTETVRERIQWAKNAGIAGIGFWALGYETEDFWGMIAEETVFAPDDTGDTGGADDDSGAADSGGAEDTAPVGPPGARTFTTDDGGCGCTTAEPGGVVGLLALLLLRKAVEKHR